MQHQYDRQPSVSGEILSHGQFRTNSNPQLHEQSFGNYQDLGQSYQICALCSSKQTIMKQLWVLKQAVEAKNRKIIQLEQFIHRLSQMVLSQHNELNTNFNIFHDKANTSEKKSSQQRFQSINSSNNCSSLPQSASNDFRLKDSSFKSEINQQLTAFESEYAKSEIRKQLQKMSLRKNEEPQVSNMSRESSLKKKLNQIMNLLPNSSKDAGLRQFQSLSEPLHQGTPGKLNQRPTLKIPKNLNQNPNSLVYTKHDSSQVLQQSKCMLAQ